MPVVWDWQNRVFWWSFSILRLSPPVCLSICVKHLIGAGTLQGIFFQGTPFPRNAVARKVFFKEFFSKENFLQGKFFPRNFFFKEFFSRNFFPRNIKHFFIQSHMKNTLYYVVRNNFSFTKYQNATTLRLEVRFSFSKMLKSHFILSRWMIFLFQSV